MIVIPLSESKGQEIVLGAPVEPASHSSVNSFEDLAWASPRLSGDLKYLQTSSKAEAKQLCLDDVAAAVTSVQSGEQDDVRLQRSLWAGP